MNAWGVDLSTSGGFPVERERRTPLHAAGEWNLNPVNPAVLEALVSLGADLDARNSKGRTPLHEAARRNPAAFPALLRLGADLAATDDDGRTPLDYARQNRALQGLEVVRRTLRRQSVE